MKTQKAFTLVELIVVITILAILGTIAFLSFNGYSSSARDSARLADLSNLAKGMGVMVSKGGTLPKPGSAINLLAGATTIGYQGYADKAVIGVIGMSESKDPLDGVYYTYSTNASQNKYQVLGFLESGDSIAFSPISTVYADPASYAGRTARTIGTPIGVILRTSDLLPLQSIKSPGSGFDVADSVLNIGYTAKFSNTNSLVITTTATPIITAMAINQPKTLPSLDPSLIGYWDLETTAILNGFKVFKDISKIGNTGACYNGANQVNCSSKNSASSGVGLYFDGNDSIQLTDSGSIFQNLTFSNDVTIVTQYNASGVVNDGFGCEFTPTEAPLFSTYRHNAYAGLTAVSYTTTSSTYAQLAARNLTSPLNNQQEQVFVKSGGSVTSYVNGILQENKTITSPFVSEYNFNGAYIGATRHCASQLSYYTGYIKSIKIYNRALSDAEVTTLYNATK